MTFIRWIKRGCRFQLYRDFYGRLKIKPMGVCANPQWIAFGSLWKCIKEYIIKIKRENDINKTKKELSNFFNKDEDEEKEKEQDESCPDCLCEDCDKYCISKELGLIK